MSCNVKSGKSGPPSTGPAPFEGGGADCAEIRNGPTEIVGLFSSPTLQPLQALRSLRRASWPAPGVGLVDAQNARPRRTHDGTMLRRGCAQPGMCPALGPLRPCLAFGVGLCAPACTSPPGSPVLRLFCTRGQLTHFLFAESALRCDTSSQEVPFSRSHASGRRYRARERPLHTGARDPFARHFAGCSP